MSWLALLAVGSLAGAVGYAVGRLTSPGPRAVSASGRSQRRVRARCTLCEHSFASRRDAREHVVDDHGLPGGVDGAETFVDRQEDFG